jgi:hypothetical protein
MQQVIESGSRRREQWESECLEAMLKRIGNLDRDEARQVIRAAWSIERFRSLAPVAAAARLLENTAIRPAKR